MSSSESFGTANQKKANAIVKGFDHIAGHVAGDADLKRREVEARFKSGEELRFSQMDASALAKVIYDTLNAGQSFEESGLAETYRPFFNALSQPTWQEQAIALKQILRQTEPQSKEYYNTMVFMEWYRGRVAYGFNITPEKFDEQLKVYIETLSSKAENQAAKKDYSQMTLLQLTAEYIALGYAAPAVPRHEEESQEAYDERFRQALIENLQRATS